MTTRPAVPPFTLGPRVPIPWQVRGPGEWEDGPKMGTTKSSMTSWEYLSPHHPTEKWPWLLVIITGYFNGIIHSINTINGVF